MGREARCTAVWNRQRGSGLALLETDGIVFRGAFRVSVLYSDITAISAEKGELRLETPSGSLALELGNQSLEWAERIRRPPSRLDKLGIKPGMRVSVVGIEEDGLADELRARGAEVTMGRATKGSDVVLVGMNSVADLRRFERLQSSINSNGAIWSVRPKGRADVSESAVMQAARSAGLVDVKVVRFSTTHTAEKFVIPRARR
jgi:hypothetical protein